LLIGQKASNKATSHRHLGDHVGKKVQRLSRPPDPASSRRLRVLVSDEAQVGSVAGLTIVCRSCACERRHAHSRVGRQPGHRYRRSSRPLRSSRASTPSGGLSTTRTSTALTTCHDPSGWRLGTLDRRAGNVRACGCPAAVPIGSWAAPSTPDAPGASGPRRADRRARVRRLAAGPVHRRRYAPVRTAATARRGCRRVRSGLCR
jgi:hypothetical protein